MDNLLIERINNLMQKKGLKQKELAQKLNLTESAVSRYLHGSRIPKGAVLVNIANVLCTSTDYLTGKTEDIQPNYTGNELDIAFQLISKNLSSMTAIDKTKFIKLINGKAF